MQLNGFPPLQPPAVPVHQRAYLHIEPRVNGQGIDAAWVTLLGEDPCPAFLIIRAADGTRRRIPRAELFEIPPSFS